MKTLFYFFILNCFVNCNLKAQQPIHFENEQPKPKKVLNDELALEKYNYEKFLNEIQFSFKIKGYNFKEDACLKDYFRILETEMLGEVFIAYSNDKSDQVFKNISNRYLSKYNINLKSFINDEQWALLQEQQKHMDAYHDVLVKRIALF